MPVDIHGSKKKLMVDVSRGNCRPLVPVPFPKEVFNALHSLSHPGGKASQKLVSERYVWTGMRTDI